MPPTDTTPEAPTPDDSEGVSTQKDGARRTARRRTRRGRRARRAAAAGRRARHPLREGRQAVRRQRRAPRAGLHRGARRARHAHRAERVGQDHDPAAADDAGEGRRRRHLDRRRARCGTWSAAASGSRPTRSTCTGSASRSAWCSSSSTCSQHERAAQPHRGAGARARGVQGRGRRARQGAAGAWSGSPTRSTPIRRSCRAGSSSGWPSRGRSRCSRRSCCWTRSPRPWTPSSSSACRTCCATSPGRATSPCCASPTRWRFARDISDRVLMFDQGQIVEEGPPEQIFGEPARAAHPGLPAGGPGHLTGPGTGTSPASPSPRGRGRSPSGPPRPAGPLGGRRRTHWRYAAAVRRDPPARWCRESG